MKVLTSEQMRLVDQRAQSEYHISEHDLMEEAGRAVARRALETFQPRRVVVACGAGNNAGDGYVAARYLTRAGVAVEAIAVGDPERLRGAALEAYRRAAEEGVTISGADRLTAALDSSDLVIDALCGTGIRGPLRDGFAAAATALAGAAPPILAVDVPSGVRELSQGEELGPVVPAELTVAIGAPKLCEVVLPGSRYTGELVVEPINFPPELLDSPEWLLNLAAPSELTSWLPARPDLSNKGTFGKVGIIAGSAPYAGAAILAARAALRAGSGLVTIFTTAALNAIYKTALPEAVTAIVPSRHDHWLDETSLWAILERVAQFDVLAVGMGLGATSSQAELVRSLLSGFQGPVVLDADAWTALAKEQPRLRDNIVCTPHPGEMARWLGGSVAEVQADRFGAVRRAVAATGAHILLKGADTLVGCPDGQIWINSGACSALAKGGTGDVLAGLIASLVGQGMSCGRAAVLAARLHLEAGWLAARDHGEFGVLARDVADAIPRVIERWTRNGSSSWRSGNSPRPGSSRAAAAQS